MTTGRALHGTGRGVSVSAAPATRITAAGVAR
jgi:hypothetical protein